MILVKRLYEAGLEGFCAGGEPGRGPDATTAGKADANDLGARVFEPVEEADKCLIY